MSILQNSARGLFVFLGIVLSVFILQACKSGEENKLSSAEKKTESLAENKEANPEEMVSQFVILSASGSRQTCNYFSSEYEKSLIRDIKVSRDKLCQKLFSQSQGKVVAEKTAILKQGKNKSKAVSAVCLQQKLDLPKPKLPKSLSKEDKERILESFQKNSVNSILLGPLVTEISFNEKDGLWEMSSLPANTTFREGGEKKAAEKVIREVKKKC